MLNELKIQLESRQDCEFLREQVARFIQSDAFAPSGEELDKVFPPGLPVKPQFLSDVFAIVAQNVQIDGVDYERAVAGSAGKRCWMVVGQLVGEEVDASLEAQIEDLQVETDNLLVQIAQMRRECPQAIKDKFVSQFGELELSVLAQKTAEPPKSLDIDLNLDGDQANRLVGELCRLQRLNQARQKSLPELVAKLQRAQTVLTDSSQFGNRQAESAATTLPENISEVINRQSRIARQHELAAKLLSQ